MRVGSRHPSPDETANDNEPAAAVRVSVVIPVYDKAEYTEKCLYAIAENSGDDPNYEVIVVDNGSSDWTPYLLHAMEGDLRVLSNDRNLGFARACNQAAEVAQGEFLLFLNNDTVPHPGWLRALVESADRDPAIGIAGAKLLYPDTQTVQHAGLEMVNGLPDHVFRGVAADDENVSQARDLDMVTGACLLIRRELFESVGAFDTGYLNGVEDVDLCLRVRERGFRVVYCPASILDHHEGTSDGRYDCVDENVERFRMRWGNRFDASGRFVPGTSDATAIAAAAASPLSGADSGAVPAAVTGNWEGPFFVHSSLARVNREMVRTLLQGGGCELGLLHFDPPQFGEDADPRALAEIGARLHRPLSDGDFHLRHHWPPNFSRPETGQLVVIQPWEFGRVPLSWREPLRAVDQLWAYTNYVKQCYVDSGVNPERIAVVPLGIDPALFRPGVAPSPSVPTDSGFVFLFVGGTLFRKGIDLLLAAYRQEFRADEDVSLVVKDMGVNSFYRNQTAGAQIAQLMADPACAEVVYLTQDLPDADMPGLYSACDTLVHPYRGEGFGLPVAEAMACGLPVIVTRGGATDDFCPEDLVLPVAADRRAIQFEQETAGQAWLLEPDLEALKAQMRFAFENREHVTNLGRRASEYTHSHLTWTAAAAVALKQLEQTRSPGGRTTGGDSPPVSKSAAIGPSELTPASGHEGIWHPAVGGPNAGGFGETASAHAASPPEPGAESRTGADSLAGEPAGCAVVLINGSASECDLANVLGPHDRYVIASFPEQTLGTQIEAVRADAGRRQYLVVFCPSESCASSAHDTSAAAARAAALECLLAHLGGHPDIGAIAVSEATAAEGALAQPVDLADGMFPALDLIVFRLDALREIGGFDQSFETAAACGNAIRVLRGQGWRVCEASTGTQASAGAAPGSLGVPGSNGVIDLSSRLGATAATSELAAVIALEEGDCLRVANRRSEAAAAYERALAAKPNFVEAILVAANTLVDLGRQSEAQEVIQELINLDPQSSLGHNFAGLVHFRLKPSTRHATFSPGRSSYNPISPRRESTWACWNGSRSNTMKR